MGAAWPAGQYAILILAHMRHDVGDPDAGADQRNRHRQAKSVHQHAVAEVVGLVGRALEFFQIWHRVRRRGLAWYRAREQRAARTKRRDMAFGFTRRWTVHD